MGWEELRLQASPMGDPQAGVSQVGAPLVGRNGLALGSH